MFVELENDAKTYSNSNPKKGEHSPYITRLVYHINHLAKNFVGKAKIS